MARGKKIAKCPQSLHVENMLRFKYITAQNRTMAFQGWE
jgi:hypothetical protein